MPRIGFTGHANLTAPTARLVFDELSGELRDHADGLVGVSLLARGADQIFARAVLDLGGTLEVVLPADDYCESEVSPDNAATFDELITKAATVTTMPYRKCSQEAYLAAAEHVLGNCDLLVAVWDGISTDGDGGTGEVVAEARRRGIAVDVVWPEGAARA